MLPVTRSLVGRIVRVRFGVAFCCFGLLVLAVLAAGTASAQTTINQTSCVSGCTNPLQDLTVDCSTGGNINAALASIADRTGPNRITVSGTCNPGVTISGFNRLTIQGTGGATIKGGVVIVASRSITLSALTLDFHGTSANLTLSGSQVVLDGVTVKNSTNLFGINVAGSNLSFGSISPSLVTGNGCNGIEVSAESILVVANVTISNNGSAPGCGKQQYGINVHNGGSVKLSNTIGAVDISGNFRQGILIEGGTLTSDAQGGTAPIRVHDNGGPGLVLVGGTAFIGGHVQFDNNDLSLPPSQIVAFGGGVLDIGAGAVVQGGSAAGGNAFAVIGNAFAVIGDDEGPTTITGGASFSLGSIGLLTGANSIDTLSCDGTSWVSDSDHASTVGTSTCPSNGAGVLSISAGSGISSTGGQMPTLSLDTSVTDARYLQLGGGTLTGGLAAPSFTGNGAGLTSLTPANLSAGTAAINVSGNAATATNATNAANAALLGGVSPTNYARRDVDNAFAGTQSVNGSLAIGGGTAITQHLSATYSIALPSFQPNTCRQVPKTLTGAVAGANDTIALGVPNSFLSAGGFLMFQAWESAANTIAIRICNVSPNGPASSAVSGTLRVDLWKH